MGKYEYSSLEENAERTVPKELRILTLLPGGLADEVCCTLVHHPLPLRDEQPRVPYEALSWTWGFENEKDNILIVDTVTETKDIESRSFAVKPNLYQALRHLRYPDRKRSMWVDFVCIQQNDTHEKDLQVKFIFDIYSKATNVCVWLGMHEHESARAMDFIKNDINNLGNFRKITENESTKNEWKALAALMDRPWFNRRWIVQELALAKEATVHCEDRSVTWTEFETAVSLFDRDANRLVGFFKGLEQHGFDHEFFGDVGQMGATRLMQLRSNMFRFDEDGKISDYRMNLTDLVSNLWSFRAKDPRDLIYAILSLARDTHDKIGVAAASQVPTKSDASHAVQADSHGREHDVFTDHPTEPQISGEALKDKAADTATDTAPEPLDSPDRKRALNVVNHLKKAVEKRTIFTPKYEQKFFALCQQFLNFSIPDTDTHNLDIILRPWAEEPGNEKLPSWIPRREKVAFHRIEAPHAPGGHKTCRKNADPLVGQNTLGARSSYYNACHTLKAQKHEWKISDDPEDDTMEVTGFVLDEIGQIEDASQCGNVSAGWLKLGGVSDEWFKSGKKLDQKENAKVAILWRTLVADRGPDGSNTREYYRRAFEQAVRNSAEGMGTNLKEQGHPILEEFLKRVEAVVTNRRLFKSESLHKLGLAPKEAQKGDYICIIRGISVPVILRPEDQYYTVIGEAYLHTMMDGNAINVQERLREKSPQKVEDLRNEIAAKEPEIQKRRSEDTDEAELLHLEYEDWACRKQFTSLLPGRLKRLRQFHEIVMRKRRDDPLEKEFNGLQMELQSAEKAMRLLEPQRFILK